MRFFRHTPIKRKLIIITMFTSCVALFLACAFLLIYEQAGIRASLSEEMSSAADILANNSSTAVALNDHTSAEQNLTSLAPHPDIIGAVIYDKQGEVFALYRNSSNEGSASFSPPAMEHDGHHFGRNSLQVFEPIERDGAVIGAVHILCDLRDLRASLWQYIWITTGVLTTALLLVFILSNRLVITISGPISQLNKLVRTVAREKDYSIRAVKEGDDELRELMAGFNEMLDEIQARDSALQEARDNMERRVEDRTAELELTHRELLKASRLGGMAEIASNVLHNIGNVLNSVNVSAGLVSDSVRNTKAASLAKVVGLLNDHAADLGSFITTDERGKQLPAYLSSLSEHLLADQASAMREMDLLRGNIEHIKDIVAMQQSYAKVSGVKEVVDISGLVEDSLRMNSGALSRHGVVLVRKFEAVAPMNVEKHKILQILVNLIRNAKYACDDSKRLDKRITLQISKGESEVEISVSDNGIGIPAENLTRIFNHGFTTRESGHGFGLHSGALAAKEMGGSLTVQSGGLGCGAVFTLGLPFGGPEFPGTI